MGYSLKFLKTFEAYEDEITYADLKKDSIEDAIVQSVISDTLADSGALEMVVAWYLGENPELRTELDSLDEDFIVDTEEFKFWLEEDFKIKYTDLLYKFDSLCETDDTLQIWREMMVDDEFINKLLKTDSVNLGIYWSYDENAAEAHWGYNTKKHIKLVIHAKVDFEKINWYKTMLANLHATLGENEKEITLNADTELKVISISANNKKLDFNCGFKS